MKKVILQIVRDVLNDFFKHVHGKYKSWIHQKPITTMISTLCNPINKVHHYTREKYDLADMNCTPTMGAIQHEF